MHQHILSLLSNYPVSFFRALIFIAELIFIFRNCLAILKQQNLKDLKDRKDRKENFLPSLCGSNPISLKNLDILNFKI
jgi:hypothetical protein